MTDCERLRASSLYVRMWIHKQPEVKEESLTDWLLFDVSENIPRITYKAFSRHKEARETGADWEWWFLFPSFAFKMRVQAKRLKPGQDNYPGIVHTNKHGLQIEKLLRDAEQENFMPFYAFYTDEEADVMCPKRRNDEGVFMAGAQRIHGEVIAVPRRPIASAELLRHTIALSCFLCCPLASGRAGSRKPDDGNDFDGWTRFIQHYYASEVKHHISDDTSPEDHIPGMHEKIPHYVQSFIERREEGVPDWWEHEFSHSIENVNALLVYDARQRPNEE